MKLYETCGTDNSALSDLLKADNGVNELRPSPWLGYPLRLPQSNDVCRRFLDNAKPLNFKLSNDCRLARARRASHNVSFHIINSGKHLIVGGSGSPDGNLSSGKNLILLLPQSRLLNKRLMAHSGKNLIVCEQRNAGRWMRRAGHRG